MTEQDTRAQLIDPALKAAGWGEVPESQVRRDYTISIGKLVGQGKRGTRLAADYVLFYRGQRLAVIEAKKADLAVTEGLAQAKQYAEKLDCRFGFSTNGHGIYQFDRESAIEGPRDQYPTPEELWREAFPVREPEYQTLRERLLKEPFYTKSGTWQLRYYQELAIERVLDGIAAGKKRLLLTLATGTGKTAIAFQIVWKLFHAKWSLSDTPRRPRVLFLADINILADQAFLNFGAFEEEALVRIRPDEIAKKGKVPTNGSVFFTIYQTFMSGPEGKPYFGNYPPDFFDLIIIDECHRGGANDESTWRSILDYFSPAVHLGLTATPRRTDNVDTYRYFGEPVYTYSLRDGIEDGFLTPFRVKQVLTTMEEYFYTSDDEVLEGEVDPNKVYQESDFNVTIEIQERERHRVRIFLDSIDQREKTLVFCANQRHALLVRDLINQEAANKHPDYCHRVTANDGEIGNQHLRNFQDNEKTLPTILTTSKKLSTGVDAPQVRNIVLMRPIKSMIEFKQIIGRGTRLSDGKDYFTIYDFVKAHHHFQDAEWDGEPIEPEPNPEPEPPKPPRPPKPPKLEDEGPDEGGQKRTITRIKLSNGKVRELRHVMSTHFFGPEGKPISAEEFIVNLFGMLPDFFTSEAELRRIWSQPDTRRQLLESLADRGINLSLLQELQRIFEAENSDIFDVLAKVAYDTDPVARSIRVSQARLRIPDYNDRQRAFLDFILAKYEQAGVEELDDQKLPRLIELHYRSLREAVEDFGPVDVIRQAFLQLQQRLYAAA